MSKFLSIFIKKRCFCVSFRRTLLLNGHFHSVPSASAIIECLVYIKTNIQTFNTQSITYSHLRCHRNDILIIKYINYNSFNLYDLHARKRAATQCMQNTYFCLLFGLTWVQTTNFLGLIVKRRLDWKSHIHSLCIIISQTCYALWSLKRNVNIETLW